MNGWIFLLPIISAVLGWLMVSLALQLLFHPLHPRKIFGLTFQGFLPRRQHSLAVSIGQLGASLMPWNDIEEKIAHPGNVKKIMPQAEQHIDDFLRVKLVKSMPVVGMFVGDKTINNLKALFIAELEQLFPEIMKNYMGTLQQDMDLAAMITGKLTAYHAAAIETVFLRLLKKELKMVKLMGALAGCIIGLLQLAVMLLVLH